MELKEFVSETITQITNGVKSAQEQCKEIGGLVNPMLSVSVCNEDKYRHADSDYPATSVRFKVGLTEAVSNDNKTGIGDSSERFHLERKATRKRLCKP